MLGAANLGVADQRENGAENARHVCVHEERLRPRQLCQHRHRVEAPRIAAVCAVRERGKQARGGATVLEELDCALGARGHVLLRAKAAQAPLHQRPCSASDGLKWHGAADQRHPRLLP